jgi:hypothetical protein
MAIQLRSAAASPLRARTPPGVRRIWWAGAPRKSPTSASPKKRHRSLAADMLGCISSPLLVTRVVTALAGASACQAPINVENNAIIA